MLNTSRNIALAAAVLIIAAASRAAAQPTPILPGTRVRVNFVSLSTMQLEGRLVEFRGDTLIVAEETAGRFTYQNRRFTTRDVRSIDRSLGVSGHALEGALIRGPIGAAVGAVLALTGSSGDCSSLVLCPDRTALSNASP